MQHISPTTVKPSSQPKNDALEWEARSYILPQKLDSEIQLNIIKPSMGAKFCEFCSKYFMKFITCLCFCCIQRVNTLTRDEGTNTLTVKKMIPQLMNERTLQQWRKEVLDDKKGLNISEKLFRDKEVMSAIMLKAPDIQEKFFSHVATHKTTKNLTLLKDILVENPDLQKPFFDYVRTNKTDNTIKLLVDVMNNSLHIANKFYDYVSQLISDEDTAEDTSDINKDDVTEFRDKVNNQLNALITTPQAKARTGGGWPVEQL